MWKSMPNVTNGWLASVELYLHLGPLASYIYFSKVDEVVFLDSNWITGLFVCLRQVLCVSLVVLELAFESRLALNLVICRLLRPSTGIIDLHRRCQAGILICLA